MGNDDNFLLKDVAGNSEECGQKHWNGTSSPHNLTTFPQTGKWMVWIETRSYKQAWFWGLGTNIASISDIGEITQTKSK
jgi:allantoicase